MEAALPGILKNLLKLEVIESEELPDDIQHTKERRPDLLKKVLDGKGNQYVLHIEFQSVNDPEMAFRMAEYSIMLQRKYGLTVKQYVIFIGNGEISMEHTIVQEDFKFRYSLLPFTDASYRSFLNSDIPEQIMLGILAKFEKDSPELVMKNIIEKLKCVSGDGLSGNRYFNQLRVLVQLRKLQTQFNKAMEPISTFFKEEDDIFFQRGEIKGEAKGKVEGKVEVIRNLLMKLHLTDEQAAELAEVSVAFVREIRTGLNQH